MKRFWNFGLTFGRSMVIGQCRAVSTKIMKLLDRQVSGYSGGSHQKVLIEGMWDHPHHWLRVQILKRALLESGRCSLIGVYQENVNRRVLSSLRALGLSSEEKLFCFPPPWCISSAQELLRAVKNLEEFLQIGFPLQYPCYLLYDEILKRKRIGRLEEINGEVIEFVALALYFLDAYRDILKRHEVTTVVVSHPTSVRFSTLVWCALSRSIPVLVLNYRNEHITCRRLIDRKDLRIPIDSPVKGDLAQLDGCDRARLITLGEKYLGSLVRGERGEHQAFRIYEAGRGEKREELLKEMGADPEKPCAVVFGNCWPDYPNSQGPWSFNDYVEWIRFTVKEIGNCEEVNWILRPHPAESSYSETVTMRNLVGNISARHIFWWPSHWSGHCVDLIADVVVTARGSAGFEHTAAGKRVLVAAETVYTDLEFVQYARDREDYRQKLGLIARIPAVRDSDRELALIYLALTCSAPPETEENGVYIYPHGIHSERLWLGMPQFLLKNRNNFRKESKMMGRWLAGQGNSYNVFKHLHYHQWAQQ